MNPTAEPASLTPSAPGTPHEGVQLRPGLPMHYVAIEATVNPLAIGDALGRILPQVWNHLAEREITPASPPFALYHSYTASEAQLDGGLFTVEPVEVEEPYIARTIAPKQLATAWHIGSYGTLPETYGALEEWMQQNGYRPDGAPWEVYWSDPGEMSDPSQLRTEVCWPTVPAE